MVSVIQTKPHSTGGGAIEDIAKSILTALDNLLQAKINSYKIFGNKVKPLTLKFISLIRYLLEKLKSILF